MSLKHLSSQKVSPHEVDGNLSKGYWKLKGQIKDDFSIKIHYDKNCLTHLKLRIRKYMPGF